MGLIYNSAIGAYALGARLASVSSPKVKTMLNGQKESLASLERESAVPGFRGYDVWFHAASLGEFEQARPLIERLRREQPETTILLTFFSPSGYEVRKNYDKVDRVAYLPFDRPALVRRFLDAVRPGIAVFVKYEFWGNYLGELKARNIPTYIIDAIFRKDQVFFKPWGGVFRDMLGDFTHLFVQDENSRKLLSSVGVDNVTVAGDTRFDRVTDIMASTVELPGIEKWLKQSPFTLIAGSSWQPDEERYIPWLNSNPDVKAIIAPHEFDGERIEILRKRLAGRTACVSECRSGGDIMVPDDARVLIVDCFGLLSSLYRFGDVAIVGGGFGTGIHNINEAAVYGMPVAFGPKHQKFKEAADLLGAGGAFEYTSADDIGAFLTMMKTDRAALDKAGEAAGGYIRKNLGASDRIYPAIFD